MTCFLIASKYDELDENIPMIKDLIRYFSRYLPNSVALPTHREVIESERQIMKFFNWNLMIVTPTTILKLLLANGVLFDSEESEINSHRWIEMARRVSDRSLQLLESTVRDML